MKEFGPSGGRTLLAPPLDPPIGFEGLFTRYNVTISTVITARKQTCRKVIFSQASVGSNRIM